MADNSNRINLLRAIQMYDFYLTELNLYLDTHPDDKKALTKFNEVNSKKKMAYETYTENYGPLTFCDLNSDEHFTWVNNPWPWEGENN